MSKKIGILTTISHTDGNFGVNKYYYNLGAKLGEVIFLNYNSSFRDDLDLLIIPGGCDVDPNRYIEEGEGISNFLGRIDPYKEEFDRVMLPQYIDNNTPIFGICRGHQTMAVNFGGRLIQHSTFDRDGYHLGGGRHKLYSQDTIDAEATNRVNFKTNSLHHQAVDNIRLPDNAEVLYWDDAGNIEAIQYTDRPIITVQWHPEICLDPFSLACLDLLVEYSDEESTVNQEELNDGVRNFVAEETEEISAK